MSTTVDVNLRGGGKLLGVVPVEEWFRRGIIACFLGLSRDGSWVVYDALVDGPGNLAVGVCRGRPRADAFFADVERIVNPTPSPAQFYLKPYAVNVPRAEWKRLQAELADMRKLLAELKMKIEVPSPADETRAGMPAVPGNGSPAGADLRGTEGGGS